MKTINIKRNDIKIFNDAAGNYAGFSGPVPLYKYSIFIDTRDGTGYDETISKLMPLIHKFMSKFYFVGNSYEDTKQDIILHILEGIPKYDPRKETKLSTFIETRVRQRLTNEVRDKNRMYRNATFLNVASFHASCKCGFDFFVTASKGDDIFCTSCGQKIKDDIKASMNAAEVNESQLIYLNTDRDEKTLDELPLSDYSIVGSRQNSAEEQIIFKEGMSSLMAEEDAETAEIINLVFFHDYSVKAAAKKVGVSGVFADLKMKDLQNNKIIKELLNR